MEKIYYDNDADLKYLDRKTVGIIGYGIQGRAQALNMRDSKINVLVANRADKYKEQAIEDGFKVYEIDELVKMSDIILFLIPDQAQAEIYEKFVKNNFCSGNMLVFAHGYALTYQTIKIPSDIDVVMLAPRMPGRQIRDYFLKGGGVPAFIDIVQNKTGLALERLLSLSRAVGFTRAGVLQVNYKIETELDLFIEQFLVASIVKGIHTSFNVLVNELGYPAVPTLMELYASGELAEVLKLAANMGIGKVFQKNASPTCQYGIATSFDYIMGSEVAENAKQIIKNIKNGTFAKELDKEGKAGYPRVRKLWEIVDTQQINEAHTLMDNLFRWRDV
jgi:ketol-acid reductoisomerase